MSFKEKVLHCWSLYTFAHVELIFWALICAVAEFWVLRYHGIRLRSRQIQELRVRTFSTFFRSLEILKNGNFRNSDCVYLPLILPCNDNDLI